ncbi:hypothetical protein, partial [Mycobacterium sp.]|uniref:WD40 repeat domain-containing protein n=1 Tax=Mycobacterium sp. TaxID=1785 RepID=UPI002D08FE1C
MRSAFSLLILAALTGIWPSLHAQSVELVDANPLLRVETGRHSAPVRRLSVSESRGLAVTASDDKTARVWDLRTGTQVMALRPPIGRGEIGRLYGAAIHPTQPLVAVGGTAAPNGKHGTIYMFDLESGRIVRSVDSGIGDIKRISWSADGTVLLVGFSDPGAIRAFSVQGRSLFDEPTEGPVYGIAAGPRGLIAATDFAGRVVLLRAVDGLVKRLTEWPVRRSEPWGVAISPDEATLAVGYRQPLAGPELIEASSGRIVRRLQPRGAVEGNFGVVAYGQDGRTIAVGGSGSASGHRFPVWIFDADDGHQREVVEVASNSVLDLVGLRGGRFGYTSFDGSWGVVGQRVELHIASGVNDLRGPSNLAASADLRRVGWAFDYGGGRATFDLSRRVIEGPVSGLATALTRRTLLDTPLEAGIGARGVARTRSSAQVNGVTISFTGVELASCGTYLHATRDAILGTTRALYRIDGNGHELWRVPTAAEVDAVVASDDDRLLVTAMSDGLIQWRRAVDGAELLSMLASRDGRWIIWTPEGYFDASPGADALAGWVVNRGADSSAEFFSLGRFRDRYHRPDVIDNVLNTLDTHQAIEQARPTARPSLLTIEPASTLDVATASLAPLVEAPPPVEQFPPTLVALVGRRLQASGPDVQIPFALRSVETGEPPQIEVRLEGRPAATKRIDMPGKLDGSAQGLITVDLGAGSSSSIVLVARNASGVSEPLSFEIDLLPSAPTTKPKGIAVEQQPASAANEAVSKAQMPTASPASTTGVARPSSDLPAVGPPAAVAARVRPIKPGPTLYLLAVGISEYERTEYRLGF